MPRHRRPYRILLPAIVRSTISPRDGSHNAPYFNSTLVSPSYRMHSLIDFRYSKSKHTSKYRRKLLWQALFRYFRVVRSWCGWCSQRGTERKIKKADYQYGEEHGLHGTSEVLQMRERVRKEWWSICGKTYNACERPASSYGDLSRTPWCYLKSAGSLII